MHRDRRSAPQGEVGHPRLIHRKAQKEKRAVTIYKTARICVNGHVLGFDTDETFDGHPGLDRHTEGDRFCHRCGSKAINKCPQCEQRIKGEQNVTSMAGDTIGPYTLPAFCGGCGNPYPWTQQRIQDGEGANRVGGDSYFRAKDGSVKLPSKKSDETLQKLGMRR